MSTNAEKVQAQRRATAPLQPWSRHLIGPVELEGLLRLQEETRPILTKDRPPTADELPCLVWRKAWLRAWTVTDMKPNPESETWWLPLPPAPE